MNEENIDWNNAPEWATHYVVANHRVWIQGGGFHRYDRQDGNYWDSKDNEGSYWTPELVGKGAIAVFPRPKEELSYLEKKDTTGLTKWELIDRDGFFEHTDGNFELWEDNSKEDKYFIGVLTDDKRELTHTTYSECLITYVEFKYFKQVALNEDVSPTTEIKIGDTVSIADHDLPQEVVYISKGQVCVEDRDGLLVVNAEEVSPYVEPPMTVLDYISKEGLVKEGSYHYSKIKELMEES